MHHLRNASVREWSSFSEQAESELRVDFNVKDPATWKTLRIRQIDVKQSWNVAINGVKAGNLISDEKDLTWYLAIPESILVRGKNSLVISSTSTTSDDIAVGDLQLQNDLNKMQSAALKLTVVDKLSHQPIPARITILDQNRSMHQVWSTTNDKHLVIRPGCVYTSTGKASLRVPIGQYTVFATRGFEYGVDSFKIELKHGEIEKTLNISREVDTKGWVSSDTHVHTFSHSGHGDATDRDRVITLAGEGIELPVITDHNVHINLTDTARKAGLNKLFTLVTGDEVTTKVGHFNVFPVDPSSPPIDPKVENWSDLTNRFPKDESVIILNHANDIHINFRPFDASRHISAAGVERDKWPFPANAMEVLNSGSQQSDLTQLFHQWMAMLNSRQVITPVGSSDSHDVSRYIVGQGRTYIKVDDADVGHINIAEAVRNFRDGKVMVSCGLLTKLSVDNYGPGDFVPGARKISVRISVEGPSWAKADHLALFMNGTKIREENIKLSNSVVKWEGQWEVELPAHDVFLTAIATGPGDKIPFWPIEKPYQPTSIVWTPRLMGSSGAIWIDSDKDGMRSSANFYAKQILRMSNGDLKHTILSLNGFDHAVAIQVAAILTMQGMDFKSDQVQNAINTIRPDLQKAFLDAVNEVE